MGRDKAFLMWDARPLVEDIAAKLRCAAGNVALVGAAERYQELGMECLPDLRPGWGPMSGIESALQSGRGEWNLILACDMPHVQTEWLSGLLKHAQRTGALCTAARDETGAIHPLCAVYRSGCLPIVQDALTAGRVKVMDLLRELDAAYLDVPAAISNVNTPEEWIAVNAGNGN